MDVRKVNYSYTFCVQTVYKIAYRILKMCAKDFHFLYSQNRIIILPLCEQQISRFNDCGLWYDTAACHPSFFNLFRPLVRSQLAGRSIAIFCAKKKYINNYYISSTTTAATLFLKTQHINYRHYNNIIVRLTTDGDRWMSNITDRLSATGIVVGE